MAEKTTNAQRAAKEIARNTTGMGYAKILDVLRANLGSNVKSDPAEQYVYVVSWSGGYEAPSFEAKPTRQDAIELALEWAKDLREGEDSIDILYIDLKTLLMGREELTADERAMLANANESE